MTQRVNMEELMSQQDNAEALRHAREVATHFARGVGDPGDRSYLIVFYMTMIQLHPEREVNYRMCLKNAQQMSC